LLALLSHTEYSEPLDADTFYSMYPPSTWGPSSVGRLSGKRPLYYVMYGTLDTPIVRIYRRFSYAVMAAADAEHSRLYGGNLTTERQVFTTWDQCCYYTAARRLYRVGGIELSFQQYLGRNYATPEKQADVLLGPTTATDILGYVGDTVISREKASAHSLWWAAYPFEHDVHIDLKALYNLSRLERTVRSLTLSRHDQAVVALWSLLTPRERYAAKHA
jgi:hypothetical protein